MAQGIICIPPNEWQHWRVLLVDHAGTSKTVALGPECEAQLMARDGYVVANAAVAVLHVHVVDVALTSFVRSGLALFARIGCGGHRRR